MIGILIAIAGTGALLYFGEWLHRSHPHRIGPEFARKFIHITVGTFAAFWPFFISYSNIELLSLLLFFVVLISHKTNYFKAIHSVPRKTWGDLFFAMSIGLVALVSQNNWIFAAAILQMSLADGFAAIFGILFGHNNRYKIFGYYKSVVGTVTFYVFSFVIIAVLGVGFSDVSWSTLVWLPLLATGLENVGVNGVDNLLVPVIVAILL